MTDLRQDVSFIAAVDSIRYAISTLANNGIPDAVALVARGAGLHHLQGHAHSIIPLAVAFLREYPIHLDNIKKSTLINHNMNQHSHEARDRVLWDPIKSDFGLFIIGNSNNIVSEEISTLTPQTVKNVADTYLPVSWSGGQPNGGGGATVVKRTIKLVAHTFR